MPQSFPITVNALRAAAESTRLRLLALLKHGELTVGEICAVLGQSQPRISRHLKLLCSAELLVRFREEHWVYYRVPLTGVGQEIVAQLLQLIPIDDPVLQIDRKRMTKILTERSQQSVAHIDVNAALHDLDRTLLEELGTAPLGELLDIATGSGRILRALAPHAARAVGIDISTEALRFARKQAYGAGLSRCVFRRGDMYALPFDDCSFDTVTLERVLVAASRVDAVMSEAARALRANGRLCVVEDFELLAESTGKNPLVVLRESFERAGLVCERLRPIDGHGVHLLIAIARKSPAPLANAA